MAMSWRMTGPILIIFANWCRIYLASVHWPFYYFYEIIFYHHYQVQVKFLWSLSIWLLTGLQVRLIPAPNSVPHTCMPTSTGWGKPIILDIQLHHARMDLRKNFIGRRSIKLEEKYSLVVFSGQKGEYYKVLRISDTNLLAWVRAYWSYSKKIFNIEISKE